MKKKTVVISAVNIIEGGPLRILHDSISAAINSVPRDWRILVLVNSLDVIDFPRIRCIAIPSAKKSWFFRLYWEWIGFRIISKKIKPDLWMSLHDITSNVVARRQVVYCHNASPFYRINLREALLDPKFLFFNLFYKTLYQILISRNQYIIVQQNWIRDKFKKFSGVHEIIVAHPIDAVDGDNGAAAIPDELPPIFLYPTFPRIFKNIEMLFWAVAILVSKGIVNFEVRVTISPGENSYTRWLYKQFNSINQIKFIGRQSATQMVDEYEKSSVVVFPSKLETWGLPIVEAIHHKKPLFLVDLPYARETVGDYRAVSFFPFDSPGDLAKLMESYLFKSWQPLTGERVQVAPAEPFARNWNALWGILLRDIDRLL
ncbi:glycosyltransferase family 4 protein [Polynucleobacter paneuropaeus]|nr:glycosyltransferase family 4 protein [Polynucleobacter paneuropaeus]